MANSITLLHPYFCPIHATLIIYHNIDGDQSLKVWSKKIHKSQMFYRVVELKPQKQVFNKCLFEFQLLLSYLSGIDPHRYWVKALGCSKQLLFVIHSYSLAWILLMIWWILGYKGKLKSLTLLTYVLFITVCFIMLNRVFIFRRYLVPQKEIVSEIATMKNCVQLFFCGRRYVLKHNDL